MERLTAKVGKSIIVQNGPLPELYTEEDSLYPLVKKLSDYEDAEEQGLFPRTLLHKEIDKKSE